MDEMLVLLIRLSDDRRPDLAQLLRARQRGCTYCTAVASIALRLHLLHLCDYCCSIAEFREPALPPSFPLGGEFVRR